MRIALAVISLLFVAASALAQEPVYIDQLVETPLAQLQTTFSGLKKEGCYRIAEEKYVLITIDKKDQKPWRVMLTSIAPCRRAETGPAMDLRSRGGVELGHSQIDIVKRMGRPDTASPPEQALRRIGDMEFFYLCRVSESCARHTSIFLKDGVVSAISEWYSN